MPARNTNTGFHPPISCYGCGNAGFIKSKCPKCSQKKENAPVNAIHMFTCLTSPVALLDIEVYEATSTVCADTGASQSVGGELMFKFLRNRGQKFSEFHLAMCLADGQQSTSLVQNATVPITVGGRIFQIDLIFLPHAKGNRTLLGVDFLRTSGIVMDMRNNFWFFGDKPSFRIPFSKDVPLPVDDSPVEINSSSCPTNSIPSEIPLHSNTVDETETNDLHLREGQALNVEKRNDLMVLLNEKECESPYAAPVVLVSKSNGTVRSCIDYRKLNAITIPDKYPLPLMDVLLHDAKSTAFMSTLDLKNPVIIRYKRMPFGLRNAPATFQRLMDQFRNGLPNVNVLVCLDDIVVLSETQVDPKKPFIIRTDPSSYALGAVLLQGESPTDEQPVEYASKLLSSAEKKITRQQSEKPWL
ncbi:retrovirus-related Pol polyprotein from transposon 297 [Trichonephila clavipes]|nr:retrovirus-related Pol polyprotein from transposon 297 [Trichonephila clavipes]